MFHTSYMSNDLSNVSSFLLPITKSQLIQFKVHVQAIRPERPCSDPTGVFLLAARSFFYKHC